MLAIFHLLPLLNLAAAGITLGRAAALLLGVGIAGAGRGRRLRWAHRRNVFFAVSDLLLASITLLPVASPLRSPWLLVGVAFALMVSHVVRALEVGTAERPPFASSGTMRVVNALALAGWTSVILMTLALHFALIAPPRREPLAPQAPDEGMRARTAAVGMAADPAMLSSCAWASSSWRSDSRGS